MLLKDAMQKQGEWLFRWRSFLPLVLLPAVILAASESHAFERWLGHPLEDFWELFCLTVAISGLAVRIVTVGSVPRGTSGRNRDRQRADVLNTTGCIRSSAIRSTSETC